MRSRRPGTLRLFAVLITAAALPFAGCGGSGQAANANKIEGDQFRLSGTQKTAQFIVGSESFPEQQVLGAITVQALEAADATVVDRTGLGGNEAVRRALLDGEIDLTWEYTATGWLVHLGETRSIQDPKKLYRAVAQEDLKENGVRWLAPAPGNDTYAVAASEKTRRDLGVQNISDLARLARENPEKATLCFNNDDDFSTRFDGLPGLERAYGFTLPERSKVEVSLDAVYKAASEANICNFGVVFTTSGLIREEKLGLLRDDRRFFAVYNPSLTLRRETLRNYPRLRGVFEPISKELDTETLRRLNYRVEVEGQTPEKVAGDWLREKGFVE